MRYSQRIRRFRWLAAGFFGFLLLIVVAADSGHLSGLFGLVNSVPFGDTVSHFVLVGTLSLLVNLALGGRKVKLMGVQVGLGILLVGVLVTLEEISQIWFATRSFSLLDLAADCAGILLGSWLASRWQRAQRPPAHLTVR